MKFRTNADKQVVPVTPPVESKEYLHTNSAGVFVPFLQTIVTGLLVFVGAWIVSWLVFDLVDPIKPAVVLSVLSLLFVWFWRLKEWASLARIEKMTGLDLNRDGVVGGRQQETVRLKWSTINDGKNGPSYEAREADFPISKDQLVILATGLLAGRAFSEREWTGAGNPLSINEFRAIRNVMFRRGLIEQISDKDVRQGWQLTDDGWNVMYKMLEYARSEDAE